MILGGRKKQTLFAITVDNIVSKRNKVLFLLNKTLKDASTYSPLESRICQGHSLDMLLRHVGEFGRN